MMNAIAYRPVSMSNMKLNYRSCNTSTEIWIRSKKNHQLHTLLWHLFSQELQFNSEPADNMMILCISSVNTSTFLTISFKDNEFLTLKREEVYTLTGFISTCGGLLSLFMGISLLSIAEIIFHCTIGFCAKLSARKPQKFAAINRSYTNY